MNHLTRLALACASGVALSACSSLGTGEYGYSSYALVRVRQVNVGRSPHGVWTLEHAPR